MHISPFRSEEEDLPRREEVLGLQAGTDNRESNPTGHSLPWVVSGSASDPGVGVGPSTPTT